MSIKYRLIRIWEVTRYELPRFIKNMWRFRKAMWQYRPYDPHGIYVLNSIGLYGIADHIEKYGYEIDEPRLKKVAKIRRVAEIYKNFMEDTFIEQAEAELGEVILHPFEFKPSETHPDYYEMVDKDTPEEKAHNTAVFNRARSIEEEQWAELYEILKGQDLSKFNKKKDFYDQFDGSGLRGWWS